MESVEIKDFAKDDALLNAPADSYMRLALAFQTLMRMSNANMKSDLGSRGSADYSEEQHRVSVETGRQLLAAMRLVKSAMAADTAKRVKEGVEETT